MNKDEEMTEQYQRKLKKIVEMCKGLHKENPRLVTVHDMEFLEAHGEDPVILAPILRGIWRRAEEDHAAH